MREKTLILSRRPCDTNFHDDGPATLAEAEARGAQRCPRYEQCWGTNGDLRADDGTQCVMEYGHQIVALMHLHKRRFRSVADQFAKDAPDPPKGFIWSSDRKTFVRVDRATAIRKAEEFAVAIIEGPDGERAGPGANDVLGSAVAPDLADPVVDLAELAKNEGRYGYNGGVGCDVRQGHCACGAAHEDVLKGK